MYVPDRGVVTNGGQLVTWKHATGVVMKCNQPHLCFLYTWLVVCVDTLMGYRGRGREGEKVGRRKSWREGGMEGERVGRS